MKKLLLFAVLAAACLGVLAAPAFGFAVTPRDGAYIYPYDGTWVDVAGGEIVAINPAGMPIPAGTAEFVAVGWLGASYGLVKTVPLYLQYKFTLNGAPVVPTFAAGKAVWSVVYREPDAGPTFNPRMGVKTYGIDWWVSLGVLPVGSYDLVFTERFTHTTTDLLGGYFDGQHSPVMFKAGTTVYEYTYTVQ